MSERTAGQQMLINWAVQPPGEGWDDLEPDEVVWIDVARAEAAFLRNVGHYVGPGGSGAGQSSRYGVIGEVFRSGFVMWMSVLQLNDEDLLSFTDGRHRFAWIRDHGAAALPIATSPHNAPKLRAMLGSEFRECWISMGAGEITSI